MEKIIAITYIYIYVLHVCIYIYTHVCVYIYMGNLAARHIWLYQYWRATNTSSDSSRIFPTVSIQLGSWQIPLRAGPGRAKCLRIRRYKVEPERKRKCWCLLQSTGFFSDSMFVPFLCDFPSFWSGHGVILPIPSLGDWEATSTATLVRDKGSGNY